MRYSEFKTEKEFKKFLRDNGILMSSYFEEYEPRFDLLTGEQIKFKDRKTYFTTNFVDKRNMAKWLSEQPLKNSEDYIVRALKSRAEEKDWKFAPCQVECRSLKDIPALNVLEYHGNPRVWERSKLCKRFEYSHVEFQFESLEGAVIGIDSREQKPLDFKGIKAINSKFDFGDYCFIGEPYFCNTFVERKSIQDLWGTMSKGFERFNREIERAKVQGGYIFVVVDCPFSKAQTYNKNKKYSKATAEFIFHRIREILQAHDNVQFVFSGGRVASENLIRKIGLLGENAKRYDLQYLIDMKLI